MKKITKKQKIFAGIIAFEMIFAGLQAESTGFENNGELKITKVASYVSGISNKDGGVCEIIDYDYGHNNAWVVNGTTGFLDIIFLDSYTKNNSEVLTSKSIDVKNLVSAKIPGFEYGDMTSVSISSNGFAAVALQHEEFNKNGYVAIFNTEGNLISVKEAGIQPDMVKFTPDAKKILVANEGEPRKGIGSGVEDPKGSVTIIDFNFENPDESVVTTLDFTSFDSKAQELKNLGIMTVKDALPSTDFEPEYIACDDRTAFASCQENNAIAVIDLDSKKITKIFPLGYKDFGEKKNSIDLIEDGKYKAYNYKKAVGAYMPDGISFEEINGKKYIFTANEGDAREWGEGDFEYVNEIKTTLNSKKTSEAEKVRAINSKNTDGLPDKKTVLYGGRSFSIYEFTQDALNQVFDSANDFEVKTAEYLPKYFNSSNDDNEFDSRSRKKGPEPETVVTGKVNGKIYAFIGLERIGGIMIYDVTNPPESKFVNYINTRDFNENPDKIDSEDSKTSLKGDVAPEGMCFIPAENSPTGKSLLLVAYEVSGTVAVYEVE